MVPKGARSLVHNIWTHDLANRLKMRRKSQAKSEGLGDDYDVGTYPSNSFSIEGGGGIVKGALLAATLLLGGGGAVVGLLNYLKEDPPVTTPIPPLPDKVNVIDIGSG